MTRCLFFFLALLLPAGAQPALDYTHLPVLIARSNDELLEARQEVRILQARVDEAEAQRGPTFVFNGLYENKSRGSLSGQLPDERFIDRAEEVGIHAREPYLAGQNGLFNRAVLTVPIYTGGRLEAAMQEARAQLSVGLAEQERLLRRLLLTARRDYLRLLLLKERSRVAEENLAESRELARQAQSRLDSGVGNAYELEQARVAVAQAEDARTQTRAERAAARAELERLLPNQVPAEWHSPESLTDALESVPPGDLAAWVESALAHRPELQQWRGRLAANQAERVSASSTRLPQLSCNLTYDILGNPAELRSGFDFLASLLIPLWDGGVSQARVDQAELRKHRLELQELQEARTIALEIVHARLDLEEAASRQELAQSAWESAREAERIALKRYQVGAGTSLEVALSQARSAQAGYARADALHRTLAARATLRYAVGAP